MDIAEIEKSRKFRFFTLSGTFGVGLLTVFIIFHLINGFYNLVIVDLALILILALWYIAMRKIKAHIIVYRAGLSAIVISLLYTVAAGGWGPNILYTLFFIPLALFFYLNKNEGAIWCGAIFAILCLLLLQPFPTGTYKYQPIEAMYFLLSFSFVIIIAYQVEAIRSQYSKMFEGEQAELKKEKERLEQALQEIKTLSGMLPICASCKKIRDDKGYWNKLEEYMAKHSNLKFSHSICPDCAEKLYPDLNIYDDANAEDTPKN